MTKSTREIDRLIREALSDADAEVMSEFGEQSIAELITEVFRGRQRLFAVGGFAANLLFFVIGIFAVVQFLQAPEIRDMLLWGAAAAFCFAVITAIKIWYWMEMTRNALLRDIKRVELQIAQLAQRL